MKILLFLMWFIPLVVLVWHLLTKGFLNPYKLIFKVGPKGSGKTTDLAKEAQKHLRKGWRVYTTERIPGTFVITADDIGYIEFPWKSCIFIDEASLWWPDRAWKNMDPKVIEWFRKQRHRGVKVFLYSQSFDVDCKLRQLCDSMYLLNKSFRVFTYGKRILKKPDLIKPSPEASARLDDILEFDSFLFFWCGSRTFTYIPNYIHLFDSFECDPLKEREFEYIEPRDKPNIFQIKHFVRK